MIAVNELSEPIGDGYLDNECSRYCTIQDCAHFIEKAENQSGERKINYPKIYRSNIKALNNNGIGLNAMVGLDIKISNKFYFNSRVEYSFYQYFKNPIETTKSKTLDLLTNTTTEIETAYDPNSPNVFQTNTGGSNYFGRTDLTLQFGLTYKMK